MGDEEYERRKERGSGDRPTGRQTDDGQRDRQRERGEWEETERHRHRQTERHSNDYRGPQKEQESAME